MAMLALAEKPDGTRVLSMALTADDLAELAETHMVMVDLPKEQQADCGVHALALIPCEHDEFFNLILKLECSGSEWGRA